VLQKKMSALAMPSPREVSGAIAQAAMHSPKLKLPLEKSGKPVIQ
jgi:hypothetical protein